MEEFPVGTNGKGGLVKVTVELRYAPVWSGIHEVVNRDNDVKSSYILETLLPKLKTFLSSSLTAGGKGHSQLTLECWLILTLGD